MEIKGARQQRKTSYSDKAFFMTKEMFNEFEKRRKKEFPRVKALKGLVYDAETGEVTGSNDFIACYANTILPKEARTASQADLEKILKEGKLQLREYMADTSLVLRSNNWPHQYLANNLYEQFKARGISLKKGLPYVIPLFGLKLVKDPNYFYGLSFELTDRLIDEKLYFPALILNEPSEQRFNSDDINEATGLPRKVSKKGNRNLFTRNWKEKDYPITMNSGLSGLYLGPGLDVDSGSDDLVCSGSAGRIVIVSG